MRGSLALALVAALAGASPAFASHRAPVQAGQLTGFANNAAGNTIYFGTNGTGAPGSAGGEKLQLYGAAGTNAVNDYSVGVNGNELWLNSGGAVNFYYLGNRIFGITAGGEVQSLAAEDHTLGTVTASFTFDATMHNVVAGSRATALTAAVTATLPQCVTATKGRTYGLKKVDTSTNAVTLTAATTNAQTSTADLIDGAATVALTSQYTQVNVQCDGAGNWWRGLY